MAVKSHRESENTEMSAPIEHISDYELIFDRKKLLEITGSLIDETYNRVSGDRFRVREGDRERLAYIKLLRDLVILNAHLLKDAKAPELEGYKKPVSHMDKILDDLLM